MAERKTCGCGKKARMNQDYCLDCSLEKVKSYAWYANKIEIPTQLEITDMLLRERGGKGVVKTAIPVPEDKPQAPIDEPRCGRCNRPKSQVMVWIKKQHKCQNCLSAECAAARRAREKRAKEVKLNV